MIGTTWDRLRLLNVRELRMHPGRAAAAFAVVAVSALLLVAVFSISGSITGSAERLVTGVAGDADLEISGITEGGFDATVVKDVAAVPGVTVAAPLLRMPVASNSGRTLLIGADANITKLHSAMERLLADKIGRMASVPNGVVVGDAMGVGEGDSFELSGQKLTVTTVVSGADADRLNGGHFVIAPLVLAQKVSGRAGQIDSVLVIADPSQKLADVRSRVDDAVGNRALVASPHARIEQAAAAIAIMRTTTLLAAAVSLVVAGFLIYNAMAMAITQRRPTISTLRALGGRGPVIVVDLLFEAALLGFLGGTAGAIAGTFVGRWAIDRLPPILLQSLEARAEFILPFYAVPVAIAAGVFATVAAALVAARAVYKVAPIEALAPVGTSSADVPPMWVRVLMGVLGATAIAGSVVIASSDVGLLATASVSLYVIAVIGVCFGFGYTMIRGSAAVAHMFGAPGALAAATIIRSPRRIWTTLMSVLIAVMMVSGISSSDNDIVETTTDGYASLTGADVWVSSNAPGVLPTSPLLPDSVESTVAALPGVEKVVPTQMAFATINDKKVMIQGVAPGTVHPMLSHVSTQVRDQVLSGAGVLLSQDSAKSLGIGAGATIEMPTPHGRKQVRVIDVVPYLSGFTGALAMNLDQLRTWFDRPGSTLLQVQLTDAARPTAVAAIQAAVPADVHVFSGATALSSVRASVVQGTFLINVITWIVAMVATIALLNTLLLSVLERRREIGVLRAMGASRRFTLRMVLAEAGGVGIVGGVLGLIFGAIYQWLAAITNSKILNIDIPYHASPLVLAFAAAALVICLLGSVPPALRAARANIVAAVSID
ncbi:FtsX-like permease family protein [Nocardia sp. NPDC046763]|uniref:ABC transporter permease n=1 Tax=Nocardia sp. NPDC046763 TaxID=3155256 RepID=UPI003403E86E